MQPLLRLWSSMDIRHRLAAAAALVATIGAALAIATMGSQPRLALLYAGLEPVAAGQIVAALEQEGVPYDVQGSTILVPDEVRDRLRLTLAAQGLPAIGAVGYELLDGLSGFGTTSQMFDAAYWRAKEGELARTIATSPRIASARVHLSAPAARGFGARAQPSASVSLVPAMGPISAEQARAIRHLVASAVPGLAPEGVSVIDAEGRMIDAEPAGAAAAADARAEAMRARVERLLEARVGPGAAVVELSLDTVTESARITERSLDPASRVVISTETEERSGSENGGEGAGVTVASNLPDGDAAGGGGASQDSETRERVNYDVSEVQREIVRVPGAVKRLTVAVLVDAVQATDESGAPVVRPRSDEELASLRALVESAVGFDAARGDAITIHSMAFGGLDVPEAPPVPTVPLIERLDLMRLAQIGTAALVAIVLGLFVLRPILAGRGPAPKALPLAAPNALAGPAAPGAAQRLAALSALSAERPPPGNVPATGDILLPEAEEGTAQRGSNSSARRRAAAELPAAPDARLRGMIDGRADAAVEVLRGWLEDPEGEEAA